MENNFKNKNILITGISGFLGSNLANKLNMMGANVIGIVRDQVRFFKNENYNIINGSIEELSLLTRVMNEYEIEICFHLAAQAIVSNWNDAPAELYNTNIKGTWNVLEACRLNKRIKSVIVASSDKAYGDKNILPYTENSVLKGHHPYEISKICSELIAKSYYSFYNLPVGITRCGNLYGPGDYNFSRIIPGTIYSLIQGNEPIIRGDGSNLRDYIYVEDAVEAYIKFAQEIYIGNLTGEAINIGTGQPHSVKDIVEQIITNFKVDSKYELLSKDLSQEIKHQYLDISKAKKLLKWNPKYSLTEGLQRTIDWYVRNIKHI